MTDLDRYFAGIVVLVGDLRKAAYENRLQKAYAPEIAEALAIADRLEKHLAAYRLFKSFTGEI